MQQEAREMIMDSIPRSVFSSPGIDAHTVQLFNLPPIRTSDLQLAYIDVYLYATICCTSLQTDDILLCECHCWPNWEFQVKEFKKVKYKLHSNAVMSRLLCWAYLYLLDTCIGLIYNISASLLLKRVTCFSAPVDPCTLINPRLKLRTLVMDVNNHISTVPGGGPSVNSETESLASLFPGYQLWL